MSVLIRGLSKPENCFSCPFFDVFSPTRAGGDEDYQCDLFVSLDYWQAAGKADKACPLIEIQTHHGRLIDADVLKKNISANVPVAYQGFVTGLSFIVDMQKTIIESETGDS